MKSETWTSYYVPDGSSDDGRERFVSTRATAGPWTERAQHGGPPAALLGRAIEAVTEPGRVVGRFAMDLLGPIPVGPLALAARVVRPGRTVALVEAAMDDLGSGRTVARAQAWTFPASDAGPVQDLTPLPHTPAQGRHEEPPATWNRVGYLDSVEWRWIEGAVTRQGPGTVWMRPAVPLVPGEEMSGLQRLLTCVDSASGVSAAVDADTWGFLNTELTVHVHRAPVGEWIGVDARTVIGPSGLGTVSAQLHDLDGHTGRATQALTVRPR